MRRHAWRSWALIAGAVGAILVISAPAEAGGFEPCGHQDRFECTSVDVPLDRTGALPGRVGLHVRVSRADVRRRGVVIVLAGGPGQAASSIAGAVTLRIADFVPTHDFAFVDQRGTGFSGALSCPEIARLPRTADAPTVSTTFLRCAEAIGPGRALYTSVQSAHDVEAVRRALGARAVTIMGFSYGTLVAQTYARLYPARVKSLILDSVVAPGDLHPLNVASHAALPRIFREMCSRQACAGITTDLHADYRSLGRRVADRALAGTIIARDGRPVASSLGGPGDPLALYNLILSSDFSPTARAALPSAIRSALDGDSAPLLRLARHLRPPRDVLEEATSLAPVLASTLCAEMPLPWTGASGFAERSTSLDDAGAVLGAAIAPYRADEVARSILGICGSWPVANVERVPDGPLPNVPALLLAGSWDVRTPLESARELAAQLPQSTLFEVEGAGHVVAVADGGVSEAVCFLVGRQHPGCFAAAFADAFGGAGLTSPTVQRVAPRSLAAVRPPPGNPGVRGRVLVAVRRTLADAVYSANFAPSSASPRVGGLRGGTLRLRVTALNLELVLRDYSYVPGVRVSGIVRLGFPGARAGRVEVRGNPSWRGTLRLRPGGALEGWLGGRRVVWRAAPVA